MRTQIIQDHNGTPTGVFIPIKDWEKMKEKYPEIDDTKDVFELSDEQKKILDERLESYLKNPQNLKKFDDLLKNKREKYNL